ncbi:hypothetical protein RFI_08079 [Reticulomyxa filosa]|uniref:Uncharacterized protein n=1 Tax=Reticulomyxa filosa TaxID=46433 RepID=X6NSW9_RETFI|nr:hypothetical protein RFI_08079 [Reticulomyxa filosa]|eukprot:ETO29048.1 hypothetical protein RFI_08079 [Reticulomyxa filosa]
MNEKKTNAIMSSSMHSPNRIKIMEQREQDKQKKLIDARLKLDEEVMKECTFEPNIAKSAKRLSRSESMQVMLQKNRAYQSSNVLGKSPTLIEGWDKFMAQQESARQKYLQQKAREKEVFSVDGSVLAARTMTTNGAMRTVPKPFRLRSSQRKKRKLSQTSTVPSACSCVEPIHELLKSHSEKKMLKQQEQYCENGKNLFTPYTTQAQRRYVLYVCKKTIYKHHGVINHAFEIFFLYLFVTFD